MSPTPRGLLYPGPLRPGARDLGARRVQAWLCHHGHQLVIDGAWGQGTTNALQAFQAAHGLAVGPVLSEETWEALTAPLRRATAPVLAPGASLRELVVAVARQHAAEHPRELGGPNAGPWVAHYAGVEGVAWCGGFVRTMARQALALLGLPPPGWTSLSVATMARLGAHLGLLVEPRDVQPGDAFFYVHATGRGHTGLVVGLEGDALVTIEGNTDASGGREGDGVYERRRAREGLRFLRVG